MIIVPRVQGNKVMYRLQFSNGNVKTLTEKEYYQLEKYYHKKFHKLYISRTKEK